MDANSQTRTRGSEHAACQNPPKMHLSFTACARFADMKHTYHHHLEDKANDEPAAIGAWAELSPIRMAHATSCRVESMESSQKITNTHPQIPTVH